MITKEMQRLIEKIVKEEIRMDSAVNCLASVARKHDKNPADVSIIHWLQYSKSVNGEILELAIDSHGNTYYFVSK